MKTIVTVLLALSFVATVDRPARAQVFIRETMDSTFIRLQAAARVPKIEGKFISHCGCVLVRTLQFRTHAPRLDDEYLAHNPIASLRLNGEERVDPVNGRPSLVVRAMSHYALEDNDDVDVTDVTPVSNDRSSTAEDNAAVGASGETHAGYLQDTLSKLAIPEVTVVTANASGTSYTPTNAPAHESTLQESISKFAVSEIDVISVGGEEHDYTGGLVNERNKDVSFSSEVDRIATPTGADQPTPYPNPVQAGGTIEIEVLPSEQPTRVTFYDQLGRVMSQQTVQPLHSSSHVMMQVAGPGVYYLQVSSAISSKTFPVSVQ